MPETAGATSPTLSDSALAKENSMAKRALRVRMGRNFMAGHDGASLGVAQVLRKEDSGKIDIQGAPRHPAGLFASFPPGDFSGTCGEWRTLRNHRGIRHIPEFEPLCKGRAGDCYIAAF